MSAEIPEVFEPGDTPTANLPQRFDPDVPLFLISTAARLAGMHPQTLRTYDRLGLVVPRRASGRGRRYSVRDVEKLRLVQYLSQEEGINLVGVRRILELQAEVIRLQEHMARMTDELRTHKKPKTSGRVFTASSSEGVYLRTSRTREILS
ncbi:MAG: helix-turn-helix transcriptional regulator [Propionibacteriaceae bacterium]|nr:helix-turn-helix transcriptional regulator [Propionibacteriaceae bacterium]